MDSAIRLATPADVPALLALVRDTGTLDLHTPYTYWTLTHSGLVLVAEHDGRLVGLLTALRGIAADHLFLWQVGLLAAMRGSGLAQALLDSMFDRARTLGIRAIDLTIAADNAASRRMIERFCARHALALESTGETGNTNGAMTNEELLRIAL